MQLNVEIGAGPDAEASELEQATLQLHRELLELDVEDVRLPPGEPPPPGARAAGVGLLGTLLVSGSGEAIAAVVRTIANWLTRRPHRSVKLQIDGDSIELTDVTAEQQRTLVESFLARHAGAS